MNKEEFDLKARLAHELSERMADHFNCCANSINIKHFCVLREKQIKLICKTKHVVAPADTLFTLGQPDVLLGLSCKQWEEVTNVLIKAYRLAEERQKEEKGSQAANRSAL